MTKTKMGKYNHLCVHSFFVKLTTFFVHFYVFLCPDDLGGVGRGFHSFSVFTVIWLPCANLASWWPDCPIARLGNSIWHPTRHGFYLASPPRPTPPHPKMNESINCFFLRSSWKARWNQPVWTRWNMSVSTRLKKLVRPIHKGMRPSAAFTKGGGIRPPPFVEPFVDGPDRFFQTCGDTHVPPGPPDPGVPRQIVARTGSYWPRFAGVRPYPGKPWPVQARAGPYGPVRSTVCRGTAVPRQTVARIGPYGLVRATVEVTEAAFGVFMDTFSKPRTGLGAPRICVYSAWGHSLSFWKLSRNIKPCWGFKKGKAIGLSTRNLTKCSGSEAVCFICKTPSWKLKYSTICSLVFTF